MQGIYSAIYSGVPVYEMTANGIAVMRRSEDAYLNATQILKVAGIEKGKRTKILEREVLTGEHEKVQGGYGKYQGTWIPLNKGKELAKRYQVSDILAPLLEYNPPRPNSNQQDEIPTKEEVIAALRKHHSRENLLISSSQPPSTSSSPYAPSTSRSVSYQQHKSPLTPSVAAPIQSSSSYSQQKHPSSLVAEENQLKRKKMRVEPTLDYIENNSLNDAHRDILITIYKADDPDRVAAYLQDIKRNPGATADTILDKQGNTALHWAAALGRFHTVERLISMGANICQLNNANETALIRASMTTHCYNNNCFDKILDRLYQSMQLVDKRRRTILHHIALTAGIEGRSVAAMVYMQEVLRYMDIHRPMISLLDLQDDAGDTALNIAARLERWNIVDMLLQAGATDEVENNIGLKSKDYEKGASLEKRDSIDSGGGDERPTYEQSHQTKRSSGLSQRGLEIVSTVQKIVDALDEEYGGQLTTREQELQQTEDEIKSISQQLEQARKQLEKRQSQSQQLAEVEQKIRNLHLALQSGLKHLEELKQNSSQDSNQELTFEKIDAIDPEENIDAVFALPDMVNRAAMESLSATQLHQMAQKLRARVTAYERNGQDLQTEADRLRAQSAEKELQCKKLIAACCNLPIDKIDELVEPLTLAIESDPPDLDLARVIGFMEKIRRQGAFTDTASEPGSTARSGNTTIYGHSDYGNSSQTGNLSRVGY
ncbi:uncharacterized protein BYT42DRAFT_565454 [Radiomyces spectabilis]|uniref:uncharacterized protein n=1 Tax=Radiomyces spectabilis TaxID=64574 RepID=UPI00221EEFF2|nr:uncharacterized protein BYT42DRAFT_565454 [Radiomyces spectabilis]KAI8381153.1 hypothetical protein BYT42DRAFT_565454 [Radiomyces spectabilis]